MSHTTVTDVHIDGDVVTIAFGSSPAFSPHHWPARASLVRVAEFAECLGPDDGHGHQEICPHLNCGGGIHAAGEHKVSIHLHQLHAAGRLLLNDHDAIRLTLPPCEPGETWRFC